MFEPEYEYRVLIDTVPVYFGRGLERQWWFERDFNKVVARAHELREINERSIVTIEISPWHYFREVDGAETWECPGCEYAECPSNA